MVVVVVVVTVAVSVAVAVAVGVCAAVVAVVVVVACYCCRLFVLSPTSLLFLSLVPCLAGLVACCVLGV